MKRPGSVKIARGGLCVLAALGLVRAAGATQGGSAVDGPSSEAAIGEAKMLFEQAEHAARAGDFDRALVLMQRSYDLSRYPWLLFNLGSLHRELGSCRSALDAFETYLKDVPNARFRKEAEQRVDELRPRCGAPRASPPRASMPSPSVEPAVANGPADPPRSAIEIRHTPPPPAPMMVPVSDSAASYWTPRRTIGAAVLGAGGVAAGVAIYYAFSAKAHNDEFEAATRKARALPVEQHPSWTSGVRGLDEKRDADRTRAIAFSVVSGALIGTGVVLLLLSTNDGETQSPRSGNPSAPRRSLALRVAPGTFFLECTANAF